MWTILVNDINKKKSIATTECCACNVDNHHQKIVAKSKCAYRTNKWNPFGQAPKKKKQEKKSSGHVFIYACIQQFEYGTYCICVQIESSATIHTDFTAYILAMRFDFSFIMYIYSWCAWQSASHMTKATWIIFRSLFLISHKWCMC